MPKHALSDARVKPLRPRASAYDIRDVKLRGFGVRILPSGAGRFFIHIHHRGRRVWKIVGDASAINVDEARAQAASLLASIRYDADAPASPDATRFEAVAETVFRRYARVWKPQTRYVNRNYLHRQILPRFAKMRVADITRSDVLRWFAARRATPVAADRSLPILSIILTEAECLGYRPEGSNPCWGIRRYRRRGRERFLSDAEIGRLAAALSAHGIALGPSETGETHVSLGLGLAACQKALSVRFITAAALVHELMEARNERRLLRLQKQLANFKLLIFDELGFVPLSKTGAELLFEVVSQGPGTQPAWQGRKGPLPLSRSTPGCGRPQR